MSAESIRIDVLSPVEFEDMVAEIYINNTYFGRITQENGEELRQLDISESGNSSFELRQVSIGIEMAIERLNALGAKIN